MSLFTSSAFFCFLFAAITFFAGPAAANLMLASLGMFLLGAMFMELSK